MVKKNYIKLQFPSSKYGNGGDAYVQIMCFHFLLCVALFYKHKGHMFIIPKSKKLSCNEHYISDKQIILSMVV